MRHNLAGPWFQIEPHLGRRWAILSIVAGPILSGEEIAKKSLVVPIRHICAHFRLPLNLDGHFACLFGFPYIMTSACIRR